MYWPLTGAFMNVSAVTLRLLLIITAYMDDLLHEDTNIFFLSITRIFFFTRIVTDFLLCPEFSNFRIFVFTRSVADSHGFSFLLFLSRIIELSNFNHTEYHGRSRISFFFLFLSRIIEFSNFCLHTEYHGQSRISSFLSRIRELSNFCLP